MQTTWFVLFYMIQAWTKEYWEKKKKTFSNWKSNWFAGSFYDTIQRQSTDFSHITLDTEQKEHIWHSCNNKARVSVVIDKCV